MSFADLPAELQAACERVASRHSVLDSGAMAGQCMVISDELDAEVQAAIDSLTIDDDDRDMYECRTVQMFGAPAELAENDMAEGHYTLWVMWDGDEYYIDMTAAQFPEIGQSGPLVRDSNRW